MSSLFDKLNTLVNAQINELLGRSPRSPLTRIKLNPEDAEKNPRRSAQNMRQRLNEALEYEDELQKKIELLMAEAMELDRQVDAHVKADDGIGARHVQGQLNLKQQQLTIAESELRNHRMMSRHLLKELAALESALDKDERAARASGNRPAQGAARRRIPVGESAGPAESRSPSILNAVTGKLDEARSGLESLLNNSPVPEPDDLADRFQRFDIVDEAPDPRAPKPSKADKPEMDARLSRLRKPADDDSES